MTLRVVGIGSPFGDDDVGWRVIEALRGRVPPGVDLVALDRPGMALVNWMADADHLVLVDAVVDGGPAGRLLELDRRNITDTTRTLSSHQPGLGKALDLAERLHCLPLRLAFFGVTISASEAVSTEVDRAVGLLAARIAVLAGAPAVNQSGIGERARRGLPIPNGDTFTT